MEQKIYKYEVVLNLLKGQNHLRQIAKDVNINHMTIKRILDGLIKENVLDVRTQGRNNLYSIKKTMEAQGVVFTSEIYKFNKLLRKHPELKQDLIELRKLPSDIVLIFGSYAKGLEKENSDVDIYIDTPDNTLKKKVSGLNHKFSVKIGKYNKGNLLISEIEKDHIVIKGLEKFYEKNKFFE